MSIGVVPRSRDDGRATATIITTETQRNGGEDTEFLVATAVHGTVAPTMWLGAGGHIRERVPDAPTDRRGPAAQPFREQIFVPL